MSNLERTHQLKLDPWAASSLLQKAIRRGEAELAKHAARTFYRQRGNAIWRRLVTIAFEDVGIGDLKLLSDLTYLATDKNLRAMVGADIDVILDLCQRLADAPKDRGTDYLFCAATKLDAGLRERALLTSLVHSDRMAIAADPAQPLIRRAVATLLSHSANGEGTQLVRGENIPQFLASFRNDWPASLHEAVNVAAQKTGHPFTLMLPILWSAMACGETDPAITTDLVPRLEFLDGIPLYTFDKHTRVGKQAIRLFALENAELRNVLADYVPEPVATDVALMAAFYADAMPITRRLEWSQSRSLEQLGREADMVGAGCPVEGITAILACVRENLGHLNQLRRDFIVGRAKT